MFCVRQWLHEDRLMKQKAPKSLINFEALIFEEIINFNVFVKAYLNLIVCFVGIS